MSPPQTFRPPGLVWPGVELFFLPFPKLPVAFSEGRMLGSAAEGPRLPHPNVQPPWNTRLGAVRSPLGSLLGEGLGQRF